MKRILLLMAFMAMTFQGFSQTKGISYQAVILNPNPQEIPGVNAQNNILANSAVSIQFTVVNASGTEEYQEQHSIRTDRYGMINLLIGTGTPTSSTDFSDIKWLGTTKKLKVGIDFKGGSNFSPLSDQNLTYMPQPPTEEVTIEITNNAAAIATEKTRAIQAEQENATDISSLKTEQTIQNAAIAVNTAKVGVTPAQASTISNTTGINTGDQGISGIAINASAITILQEEQTKQNTAITLNTAKTGITSQQTSDITTNNAKVGITTQQASDITVNNAKVGITSQQVSDITTNNAKVGITTVQATTISNTTGINTGDNAVNSNYSSLVTNATHTGDVTGATALTITNDAVTTNKILNGNVTDAKIAAVAASKLTGTVGIASGGTNITTYTQGDILYATSATQLTVLAKGTAKQVLTMNAGATAPEWVTPTSAGATHEIGDTYAGGIIFYLDPSGLHGLIAAPSSQETTATWWNGSYIDTRAYGSGLFEGKYNTNMINWIQAGATSAAAICAAYEGGTTDWYLPSIEELNLMYLNIGQGDALGLGNIANFVNGTYWSSTDYDKFNAWYQSFANGHQSNSGKSFTYNVRAVRAF